MKSFNLVPTKVIVGDVEKSVISLGETGRGRKNVMVLCPEEIPANVGVLSPNPGMPGKTKIVASSDNSHCTLARVSCSGSYVRGADGNVRVLKSYKDGPESPIHFLVEVVARGQGAYGDAGRTGTWDDLLLIVRDYVLLRVKPSRFDAYYLHFLPSGVMKLTKEEAQIYEEVDIPESLEDWVRL